MRSHRISRAGLVVVPAFLCTFSSPLSAQSQDVTPPVLTSLSLAPSINTATGPATLTVYFSATDDLSGVHFVQVFFLSSSGQQGQTASSYFPDAISVSGSGNATFPQFGEPGTWKVDQVFVSDAVGNALNHYTPDLAPKGFPTQLVVVDSPPATTFTVMTSPNSPCLNRPFLAGRKS